MLKSFHSYLDLDLLLLCISPSHLQWKQIMEMTSMEIKPWKIYQTSALVSWWFSNTSRNTRVQISKWQQSKLQWHMPASGQNSSKLQWHMPASGLNSGKLQCTRRRVDKTAASCSAQAGEWAQQRQAAVHSTTAASCSAHAGEWAQQSTAASCSAHAGEWAQQRQAAVHTLASGHKLFSQSI